MNISQNGLNMIKSFEGFRSRPYLDSTGIPTIGYGTISYPDGTRVTMDDSDITEDQAEQYLMFQINQKTSSINNMLTISVNQNQFDSLCSFVYNLGSGALHGSTLLKLVNQGDFINAAHEFHKWDHAGGVQVAGLTRRRLAEATLFSTPC